MTASAFRKILLADEGDRAAAAAAATSKASSLLTAQRAEAVAMLRQAALLPAPVAVEATSALSEEPGPLQDAALS